MGFSSALANYDKTNPSGFAGIRVVSIRHKKGGSARDVTVCYRHRYPRSGMEVGPIVEVDRKLTKRNTFRLDGWRVMVRRDYSAEVETGQKPVYEAYSLSPMSEKATYNNRIELVDASYDNETGERLVYSYRIHKYQTESENIALEAARQTVTGSFTAVESDPLSSLPQSENANTGTTGDGTPDVNVNASSAQGTGSAQSGSSTISDETVNSILQDIDELIGEDNLGYDQTPSQFEGVSEGSGSPQEGEGNQGAGEDDGGPESGSERPSGGNGDDDDDESWAIPYSDQQRMGKDPDEEFDEAEAEGKGEPEAEEEEEVRHEEYETIKACMWAGIPVYLSGPAGSGKNYTVEQICRDMDWDFYFSNSIQQEYKITGFIDAGGTYHETEFYKACTSERECAFFIDEMDNSVPEVLVLLNAAIANGYFEFPTGRVEIKNVHFVAAGNTTGSGADDLYTGRMVLDQASLDRFAQIQFNYSMKIELKLSHGNEELVKFIHALRNFAEERGIRATFSYRCIDMVTRLEAQELPMIDILKVAVFKGLDADTVGTFRDAVSDAGYSRYSRAATTICGAPANYFSSGRY